MNVNGFSMMYFRIFLIFLQFFIVSKAFAQVSNSISLDISGKGKYLSIPFPNNVLLKASSVQVFTDGTLVNAEVSYGLLWPSNSRDPQFIRLANVTILDEVQFSNVTLVWQQSEKELNKSSKGLRMNSTLVYPSMQWLRKTLLLTEKKNVDEQWYRQIQALKAEYVIDEKALIKNNYPRHKAGQWLYDRAQAIYQLYLASGDLKWKRYADRFITFYKSQIDEDGFFKLAKPNDIKYLMGRSLVYHYLLNQSESSLEVIKRLYQASLTWEAEYSTSRNFWTERHHAAALNVAISYWEMTNDQSAKFRIEQLISSTAKMTFSPENNWSRQNCPQHSFKSHEGWGDNTPACSPWMMALLADNLWRYYWLTNSEKAARIMASFADFVADKGVYLAPSGKIKGQVIPKYLVSLENPKQEELEAWSDRQHTCDVSAMMGKGLLMQSTLNKSVNVQTKKVFNQMGLLCKSQHLALIEKYKYVDLTRLVSKPPRKFAWQYSSTDDLPWLLSVFSTATLNELRK